MYQAASRWSTQHCRPMKVTKMGSKRFKNLSQFYLNASYFEIPASQIPFRFDFITDSYTGAAAAVAFKGFKLVYWQTTC